MDIYISSSTSKGPDVNLEDIYEDWVTIKTFVIAEVSVLLDEDNLGDFFKADPFEFFGYLCESAFGAYGWPIEY